MLAVPQSLELVVRLLATHVSPADCNVELLRSVSDADVENRLLEPACSLCCSDPLSLFSTHSA
jgi:hypothetical protein